MRRKQSRSETATLAAALDLGASPPPPLPGGSAHQLEILVYTFLGRNREFYVEGAGVGIEQELVNQIMKRRMFVTGDEDIYKGQAELLSGVIGMGIEWITGVFV